MLRVLDPFIERVVGPDDAGRFERGREARQRLVAAATGDFQSWLLDRRNRRVIPYRLESAGYVQVSNDAAQDGLWKISGKRQVIFARNDLLGADRLKAARQIMEGGQ